MYAPVTPRVGEATANSVLGLSASGLEYKELVAGAGISIVHTVGAIILTVAASEHVHNISELATEVIVSGDFVSFWDITPPASPKKITFANFESTLAHDNLSVGTIAAHDTTATGANLTSLTDDSMVDSLHRHSELSASDGTPSPALSVDAAGTLTIFGPLKLKSASTNLDELFWFDVDLNEIFSLGGDAGSHTYLRTHTARDFYITTNNIKRMTIESGGNIGIGIDSPGTKLTVSADTSDGISLVYSGNGNDLAFLGATSLNDCALTLYDRYEQLTVNIGTRQNSNWISFGNFCIGDTIADARLEVSTGVAESKQAITIDQNDIDEAFIDHQGTSAANVDNNITTWTTGNSIQGFIKQEINGSVVWMPYYNAPTS